MPKEIYTFIKVNGSRTIVFADTPRKAVKIDTFIINGFVPYLIRDIPNDINPIEILNKQMANN